MSKMTPEAFCSFWREKVADQVDQDEELKAQRDAPAVERTDSPPTTEELPAKGRGTESPNTQTKDQDVEHNGDIELSDGPRPGSQPSSKSAGLMGLLRAIIVKHAQIKGADLSMPMTQMTGSMPSQASATTKATAAPATPVVPKAGPVSAPGLRATGAGIGAGAMGSGGMPQGGGKPY